MNGFGISLNVSFQLKESFKRAKRSLGVDIIRMQGTAMSPNKLMIDRAVTIGFIVVVRCNETKQNNGTGERYWLYDIQLTEAGNDYVDYLLL